MQKTIFFFSLFFTHIASATNWGIETLLTPDQRPERSWMTHFSATPDIISGASLSDAIKSCSQTLKHLYNAT